MKKVSFTLGIGATVVIIFAACISMFTSESVAKAAGQTVPPVIGTPMPQDIYAVDGQEFTGSQAVSQRDLACKRTIPVTPQGIKNVNAPENRPIVWHIVINFKVKDNAGNPMGCFRLYELVGPPGTTDISKVNDDDVKVNEIDGGGFLINTCKIIGDGVTIDWDAGQAQFKPPGYIQCKINIRQWLATLQFKKLLSVSKGELIDTMKRLPQRYNNLVLYAHGAISDTFDSPPRYPIVYYTPDIAYYQSTSIMYRLLIYLSYPPIGMALRTDDGVFFYSLLRRTHYQASQCAFSLPSEIHELWMNFDNDKSQPQSKSNLFFAWRAINTSLTHHCDKALLQQSQQGQNLNFWIGEATLDIGHWPKTTYNYPTPSGDPEMWFNGTLQEVLIDPGDSKPPR